jgi:hypothetical protein
VSDQRDDFARSVEVAAESLNEAVALGIVALGIKAMQVPRDEIHPSFDVKVQAPEVWHYFAGAAFERVTGAERKVARGTGA